MPMLRFPAPVLRAILASRNVVVSSRQFTRKIAQNSAQGDSYASTGPPNHGKKSSEMAWLVGSIAVTVPSALYLLYSSPANKTDHHHSNHNSSSSTLDEEGGPSSGGETKSQMGPTPELVSEATGDSRDRARGNFGEMGEKAGELYVEAKGKAEAGIMSATDKAASVKEGAGETFEPVAGGSQNGAGKSNQGEGKKGPDDSQVREGVNIAKEPVNERKNVEKTGGNSQSSETLSNPNRKQDSSNTPLQVDPPAAGTKGPAGTGETSGK